MSFLFNAEETVIIITSDEPWGDVWHTQLHYANQLSERCTVYYVGPPEKWKFKNLFSWKLIVKKEKENLFVLTYLNVFPVSIFNSLFVLINDTINSFLLNRKIKGHKSKIILWRFTYFRFLTSSFINISQSVYHIVDHYMGKKNDILLAKKSDLLISTSPKFISYYKRYNDHVINVPQGISNEEFVYNETSVNEIKAQFEKIILFIGTIFADISFETLEEVSTRHSDYTLLIIGPDILSDEVNKKRFAKLVMRNNVKYLGTIPGPELKNYVKAAEVCLIPYKFGHQKKITRSPLKAINYIAQKKIIITSIDSEIPQLENKLIYKAENLESFIHLTRLAVEKKIAADEKAADDFLKKINYVSILDFIFLNLK